MVPLPLASQSGRGRGAGALLADAGGCRPPAPPAGEVGCRMGGGRGDWGRSSAWLSGFPPRGKRDSEAVDAAVSRRCEGIGLRASVRVALSERRVARVLRREGGRWRALGVRRGEESGYDRSGRGAKEGIETPG